MGYSLNLSLFRDVEAADVYTALITQFRKEGFKLLPELDPRKQFALQRTENQWSVLRVPIGFDWAQHQRIQKAVCEQLNARGLILFAYDGDYWGYELYRSSEVIDRFIQSKEEGRHWFPNQNTSGNPRLLAQELGLPETDAIAYIQSFGPEITWDQRTKANTPVRPTDRYGRYDECAVLDFTHFLGVPGYDQNGVEPKSLNWKTFLPQR